MVTMTEVLLLWLVLYVSLLAAVGFVLYLWRSATRRRLSDATLLRVASTVAFVLALTAWIVLLLVE